MKQFIIMADIIGSSKKDSKKLMKSFRGVVNQVNDMFKNHLKSPLTITLGDEFQGVIDSLMTGAEIIFNIDQQLLLAGNPYSLRFVVVHGEIDTPLNKDVAYGMLGSGLTRARSILDTMKKGDREILVEGLDENKQEKLILAFELYRSLYNDWPEKDRRTAFDFLDLGDYKEVAAIHDRDNSSMWRKEKSLKMHEFNSARKLIKLLVNE